MTDGVYGLMAEFTTPQQLIQAVYAVRAAGYQQVEAYSPHPVEGLYDVLERRATLLPWLVGFAALSAAALGYAMPYFMNTWDYPLNVGGRPLHSWPAFLVMAFLFAIAAGAVAAAAGMILASGLPQLHHPVFSVPRFAEASRSGFFLCVRAADRRFDSRATRDLLAQLGGRAIFEVP